MTTSHQNEVAKLQDMLQMMRQDNDLYRKNFEKLRLEYIDLQNFYNEQHLRWRSQLETKTAEFEVLKKQLDRESQEVESMKVKLVEELEIRQRLERDIAESDKFRNMYNDLRRTFELLKSDHAYELEAMQKQMNEMRQEKDTKMNELLEKLQDAKRMMSTHKHAETVRNLERENEELIIKTKQLLSELNDVRDEKSKALAQKEQASIIQSQQYAQMMTKCQTLESENERYRKKITRMTEEMEDVNRQSNRMHDTIIKLEKEAVQMKHQLEEQLVTFNSEKTALKNNAEQRERELDREKQSLKNQVSELNTRVDNLQKQKQDLIQQLMDTKSELNEKARISMQEHTEKYARMESHRNLQQAIVKYNDLKSKSNQIASQLSNQLSLVTNKYNTLKETSQSSIEKYKEQKRRLQAHIEQLSASYSRAKSQCEVQTRQLAKAEETISMLQSELWQEKQSSVRRTSQLERDVQKLQFLAEQRSGPTTTTSADDMESDPTISDSYKDLYSNTVKQIENIADRVSKFTDSRKDIK